MPGRLAGGVEAEQPEASENDGLEQRNRPLQADEQHADGEEEPPPLPIHAPCGRQDLTPVAPSSEPERRRGPPRRAREEEQPEGEQCGQHEERRPGLRMSWMRPLEPVVTAAQKKSVARVPNTPPVGTA